MKDIGLDSLDDFITMIVMNFEDVEPVKKILSKLGDIRRNGNEYLVKFEDNSLSWEYRNGKFKQVIFLDCVDKKIRVEETGVKDVAKDDDCLSAKKNYFTKQVYSVFDSKSTNYIYSREYVIDEYKDNIKIMADVSKSYVFFDNNRYLGKSYSLDSNVVVRDRDNNVISETISNTSDSVYVLATGDKLEKKIVDGETSCYFLSKSSNGDDSFRKEITESQLDEIMSLDNDPYVIANNDIVYGVRKTNYS